MASESGLGLVYKFVIEYKNVWKSVLEMVIAQYVLSITFQYTILSKAGAYLA